MDEPVYETVRRYPVPLTGRPSVATDTPIMWKHLAEILIILIFGFCAVGGSILQELLNLWPDVAALHHHLLALLEDELARRLDLEIGLAEWDVGQDRRGGQSLGHRRRRG